MESHRVTEALNPWLQNRQHRLEPLAIIHPAPHRRGAHRLRDCRVAGRGDELLGARARSEACKRRCVHNFEERPKPYHRSVEIIDDGLVAPLQYVRLENLNMPAALFE